MAEKNNGGYKMVEKIKVTKEWVQEAADEMFEKGLRGDDNGLIQKCLDSNPQVSESSYIIYKRIDDRQRDLVYKEAQDEMAEILRQREEGLKNIVKSDGENPVLAEARWWNLRKDLWERYSILR